MRRIGLKRSSALAWCLLSMGLGGCANGESESSHGEYTVRDSLDIAVIETSVPTWTEATAWRVGPEPILDIGGRPEESLFRVASPRILPSDRLVLYDGGRCKIRFYDLRGRALSRFGRCGQGPGDLDDVSGIWPWRGDSILVVDQFPQRVSVFDASGELGRTASVPTDAELPFPFVRGVLADGSLVLSGLKNPAPPPAPGVEASRITVAVTRGLDGPLHIMGTYPGPSIRYSEFRGGIGRDRLPFTASTYVAVAADSIFVGVTDRYEVAVHDSGGTLRSIIRRSHRPVAVERRDMDWLMDRRLAQVETEEQRRAVRESFRDLSHAEWMPAFGVPEWPGSAEGGPSLLADETGHLWVFRHYRPGAYRNEWDVFSPDGVWLGNVVMPDRFEPSQIGADFVVGVWRDSLDIPHVRRYDLVKP